MRVPGNKRQEQREPGRLCGIISERPGKAVLWGCVAALLMKFFLFDFMVTEGSSMTPAIRSGAVLVVLRLAYGFRPPGAKGYLLRWSAPKAGDVVVFLTPAGDTAVKRCGVRKGDDTFFALGDNNRESYDSRFYGPVPVDRIIGKVCGVK
jgi:signal peptidase I